MIKEISKLKAELLKLILFVTIILGEKAMNLLFSLMVFWFLCSSVMAKTM